MSQWTKNSFIYLIALLLLLILPASQVFAEGEKEKEKKKSQDQSIKHIVLITVNGLGKEGFKHAYTPNINGLAASGVKTTGTVTVLPSNGQTVAASILTGVEPQKHRFYKKGDQPKAKTLIKAFAAYGRKVVLIDGTGQLKGLVADKNYHSALEQFKGHGDKGVMDQAIKEFKAEGPYFMNIILPGVDQAGHEKGARSEEYRKSITLADEQIGRFLLTINEYGVTDNTLVVVTGDHGFTDKNHGRGEAAFSEEEMIVPTIITGPGVRESMIIPPVKIVDIAPTLALLADLNPFEDATGMVLWNALKNNRGYNQYSLLEKRVSDLSSSYSDGIRKNYILEERKRLVDKEKKEILLAKKKTQQIVDRKDQRILGLVWKIRLMKLAGLVMVLGFTAGYVVEYFILRKRFLMF